VPLAYHGIRRRSIPSVGYAVRAVEPHTLSRCFLAGLAEPVRAQVAEKALAVVLDEHWERGAAAWPGIEVAPDRFARELARRLGALDSGDAVMAAIAVVRSSDVYVAIAGSDGHAAAIARLHDIVAGELQQVAIKLRASSDQTTEIHAEVCRSLLDDEPSRPAALRGYAGREDLRGYVRVIATRALIRTINRGRRDVAIGDAALFDRVLPHDDPELGVLRSRYHETVDAALRAALARLDGRARALLRYQLLDGWSIDRVGRLYGVHRATAVRWLADARDVLGNTIRDELAMRLQIATDEIDSIVRLVQSRVDMSLDRLQVPEAIPQ